MVLRAGAAFLQWRPAVTVPLQMLVLALGGVHHPDLWVVGVGGSVFFVAEAVRARRPMSATRVAVDLVVTLVLIALACSRTGALQSPMLPLLLAPVVAGSAIFGRSRPAQGLVALAMGALGVLALLPTHTRFSNDALGVLQPAALVGTGALLAMVVTGLVGAHARAAGALQTAHRDMVALSSASMEELEALGRTVAHEVKNPLTATRGLLELLAEQPLEARAHARVKVALSETCRALDLVQGYLTLARPLATVHRAPEDVVALCRHVAEVMDAHAQQRGCTLDVQATGNTRPTVAVDGAMVRQAVMNLVLNALQANARSVSMEVEMHPAGCDIRVCDDGDGVSIPPGQQPSTQGVGLQVVARVARAHGGHWELLPRHPRGSVALLRLTSGVAGGVP